MGQPFSILSLPYLTFVCYPVAKSNNPTQGFLVMQVLTLLLANLDYTQKQYFRYIARQNKPLFDVIFSHKRERIIISPSHRVQQARPYPPFFLQKHYGQNLYLSVAFLLSKTKSQRLGGQVCQGALLVSATNIGPVRVKVWLQLYNDHLLLISWRGHGNLLVNSNCDHHLSS